MASPATMQFASFGHRESWVTVVKVSERSASSTLADSPTAREKGSPIDWAATAELEVGAQSITDIKMPSWRKHGSAAILPILVIPTLAYCGTQMTMSSSPASTKSPGPAPSEA